MATTPRDSDSMMDAASIPDVSEEVEAHQLQDRLESTHAKMRKKLLDSENRSYPAVYPSPRSDVETTLTKGDQTSGSRLSLRSRLEAKLHAAKEQRGLTPSSQQSRTKARRLRERISLTTRFTDPLHLLSRPDLEKEKELYGKVRDKLKWKRLLDKTRAGSVQPGESECYDFFTKQYEDTANAEDVTAETQAVEQKPGPEEVSTLQRTEDAAVPDESVEAEAAQPQEISDKKMLIEEIVPQDLDWQPFDVTAAEYTSYRSLLASERDVYFTPSMLSATPENKLLGDETHVYVEEEGFFVGLMPDVQRRNMNILESRVLKQSNQGRAWFGGDGRVKLLPDPVRNCAIKPLVPGWEDTDRSITTVYVKAYESTFEHAYLQGAGEHELHVCVGTVIFRHHPCMSREHVLASSLNEMYDAYLRHRLKNYAVFYNEKLRTLRLALKTMKQNTEKMDVMDSGSANGLLEMRIQNYIGEIRRTCQQRDTAEAYERDLVRRMYSEWSEIKSLRALQCYSNTNIRLTVKKQQVLQAADRQSWMEEIETQLQECREEYEYTVNYPFRKQMAEYQKSLQEWKKAKMIRKSEQTTTDANESDSGGMDNEEMMSFGVERHNLKPLKPSAPEPFSEETVRNNLIQQSVQCRRNPGEAKISVEVTHTGTVTPDTQLPSGEAARRSALQSASVFAKIQFNGRDVCTTETKGIASDFKVHFAQIFKIHITQWPDSIKILIYEGGLVNSPLLGQIDLGIPDESVNASNCQQFATDFLSNRVITCNHEGVGSSVPFTLRSAETTPTSLKTRGNLLVSIAWGVDEDGIVLAPKTIAEESAALANEEMPRSTTGRPRAVDIRDPTITALWSQEGRLDPNDPSNAGLMIYSGAKEGVLAEDYFRLDQLQEDFSFISEDEMMAMRRLRVLEYRAKGISEFHGLKLIPANEHEILDSAFTAYERRLRNKQALDEAGEKKVAAGTLSAHRLEVLKFRQRVRDSVLRRFFTTIHYHTLKDIVHEDQVPDIGTLGVNLLKVAEPRRPLKPVRSERKKATGQNLTEGSVSLLVTVVRAYNLPVRHQLLQPIVEGSLSKAVLSTTTQGHEDGEQNKLSPFVSVSFQGNIKTTNTAEGHNPSWNEELQLPFSAANNDYSPENLQTIDNTLFIHVFDRVVHDASVDNRDRNEVGETSGVPAGTITHRIQNHWLGTLKIPFSTIYQQGRIDGTFKLSVPLLMLGYTNEKAQKLSTDPYVQMESQFLQPTEGAYISLFVTLEPELSRPEPVQQKFETQEDSKQISDSLTFVEDCKRKFPKRNFKTTVINIKGESVFITRYIKALQPPAILLEGMAPGSLITAEKIARFVSLIPFVSDNVIYAGICDLWSTCDQFMNMLCGDEEEHAVLLVNYFLSIGKQAYLVLGNAIPEGETAYVLTLEQSQEYLLWNASTGQHYPTTSSICPLQNVHALVNQENVWFNMQQHDIPSRVNFNIHSGLWKPLFKSTMVPQLASVQPDSLIYPETDMTYVQNLRDRMEHALKDAIMNWRPRHITRWNRSCSSLLLQILQSLESERWRKMGTSETTLPSGMNVLQSDHSGRLSQLIGSKRFVGFPMDMPFTDIQTVLENVHSTEVYKVQGTDMEFAIAVHIHPYPASVLCVWVYVAAINNDRT